MTTQLWLQQKISEESGIDSSQIGFDQEFEQFRMDSLSVITLAYELEAFSGVEQIDPAVFTEFNTINKLAEWIQAQKK